ncbi:MAG: mycofactocin biosynthesis glycosyltransferase MftF [Solirubrobacterales bacterium]
MSAGPRFELDAEVRRRDRGRLLVGGTPPRLVRLSEAGAAALDAILAAPPTAATAPAGRLELHGLIHPLPGDGADDAAVTAVVPVLDGGERLGTLVAALAAEGPVIVVDDGSRDGSGERAERAGARVIRHDSPRGPAAARNAGLAVAGTELVAFVDADCEVAPGWRRGLAALFAADPELALLAPRVRSAPGGSALARHEEAGSPLDLGPHASLVGLDRRITYLPAAALLARRDALLALGGYDESMRFGEDVDLVWRALAAGHRARYAPSREVAHRPRPSVAAFARQRAGYGGSAPELVRRHGSAAAPLRASRHSTLIWSATALLGPRALLPALATSTAIVARRGGDRRSREALAELSLRGQAGATTHLARVLTREWLPLLLALATVSRRARRTLLVAALVDSLPAWTAAARAAGADPAELTRATALHALDRAAYAAGMWREMARRRDFRALRPAPPRSSPAAARR